MDIEIVASGLLFPEGPIAMRDGSLYVVEIARGTLTHIVDGKAEIVARLDGGPNGAAMGPDGRIYICNNGGRFEFIDREGLLFPGPVPPSHRGGWIERVDPATGTSERLYEACGGQRLHAPNDIVFDGHGGFWFTDYGTAQDNGGLFHALADGSAIRCRKDGLASPNGVGLSPDQRTVYVADTSLRRLYAYGISSPGELAGDSAKMLLEMPEGFRFDSLAVEQDGTICIGTLTTGGITIVRPGGAWEHMPMPDAMTTNLCFGGGDLRDAYLTLSSRGCIGKARWPRPGLALHHHS